MDGSQSQSHNQSQKSDAWMDFPYTRLLVTWFACSACAGVTQGMNLFIELFAEAGLFADLCDKGKVPCKMQTLLIANLMLLCLSLASFGVIPQGILFDFIGGRATGMVAASFACVGALVIILALTFQSATILTIAIAMMDMGDVMTGGAMLGIMWHVPNAQGLLFSLFSCIDAPSAVLPIIFRAAMASIGLSLRACFFLYAIVAATAGLIFSVVVPSQQDYFLRAEAVLGVPITPDVHTWKNFVSSARMAGRVTCQKKNDVALLILAIGFAANICAPWAAMLEQFGTTLFGNATKADELAVFTTQVSPVVSIIASILAGQFVDLTSMCALATSVFASCLVMMLLGSSTSYWMQVLCWFINTVINQTSGIIQVRWVAFWAPPHRLGMVNASVVMIMFFSGIAMNICWSVTVSMQDGVAAYILPLRIFGCLGCASWAMLAYRFMEDPKPCMVLLERDEEELMSQYLGLKTFEDAEYVLQICRNDILRLLASQSLADRRRLVDMMNEEEVQTRWAKRCYAQGYELPEMGIASYLTLVTLDLEDQLTSFFCCNFDSARQRTPRTPRTPRGRGA